MQMLERVKDLEVMVVYLAAGGYLPTAPAVAAALRRIQERASPPDPGISSCPSAVARAPAFEGHPPLPAPPPPSLQLPEGVAEWTSRMLEANSELRNAQLFLEGLRENGGSETAVEQAAKAVEAAKAKVDEFAAELDQRLA